MLISQLKQKKAEDRMGWTCFGTKSLADLAEQMNSLRKCQITHIAQIASKTCDIGQIGKSQKTYLWTKDWVDRFVESQLEKKTGQRKLGKIIWLHISSLKWMTQAMIST